MMSVAQRACPWSLSSRVGLVSDATNERPLEEGIERDFSRQMSYGDYLRLDRCCPPSSR